MFGLCFFLSFPLSPFSELGGSWGEGWEGDGDGFGEGSVLLLYAKAQFLQWFCALKPVWLKRND